jgi:hypothetical protein
MSRSLRTILNEGNPNKVGDALHALPAGSALALIPRTVRGAVVADILVLPSTAKCAVVLSAFAVAGGATGQLAPELAGATPAAGEAAPSVTGDVEFAAADAVTEAEVIYLAFEGTVFSDLISVDAGGTEQGSLLQGRRAAVLLSAEALTGGAPGVDAVAARGTTPGAGEAVIAADPTLIEFAAADAVTSATVTYVAQPGAAAVGLVLDSDTQAF